MVIFLVSKRGSLHTFADTGSRVVSCLSMKFLRGGPRSDLSPGAVVLSKG